MRDGFKKPATAAAKVEADYNGDWSMLVDNVAATLVFDNQQQMRDAIKPIIEATDMWRFKDKFDFSYYCRIPRLFF
jgi:hypothetical protein